MRHHSVNRKFGRKKDVRDALLKSLAENLILRGKIRTTLARAKELRPYVEKLITRAKVRSLSARSLPEPRLYTRQAADSAKTRATKSYADRKGGYTRIVKLPARKSDASSMAIIEFV